MPFGVRLPDRAEIEKRLGFPTPAFWPETMEVPSFTKSNKDHNRGVGFGHKLLSPRSILRAIGFPEAPARGATGKLPSFTEDNRKQGRGAFGSCLPSLVLGSRAQCCQGSSWASACHHWRRLHRTLDRCVRGVLPCQTFQCPHTRLWRCHVSQTSTLAPGGECEVPSFARDNMKNGKGTPYVA